MTGSALLLALALANPDAWIARHNLDRYESTGKVDWDYLAGLSDDAVPVLARLGDQAGCAVAEDGRDEDDWLEWNLGRARARDHLGTFGDDEERRTDCPGQTVG